MTPRRVNYTLDYLLCSYWQVVFAAEISAIVAPDNLLVYTVMAKSSKRFRYLMNEILKRISDCDRYVDYIRFSSLIFGHTF